MNNHNQYHRTLLLYLNASKEQRDKIDAHLASNEEIPEGLIEEIRERFKTNHLTF